MAVTPTTHLEKSIAGAVQPVTHLEKVIAEYGGGGGGGSVTVDAALSETSENPVQNKVINAALATKGTYSKPSSGIPKSDLANDVQTSLGKADTALQAAPVTSVNGKTGAAVLNANDVGALPNDTPIPAAVTEQTVSGWGFTKNTGTYTKPASGIPKSDLASAVQTSLGKADTALQSVPNTYRTAAAQDLIDEAQDARINQKANTADLSEVAFSGDYNDLLNRPGDGYIFADEIPQDADHSAKYVLPDGYIYVYGEHTYHRVYNAATGGLLNKRPAMNQPVDYSETQNGILLSAPIPWDSSWTQWEKTPTIIRISGIEQLVPVWNNNAIQIWYYKTDGRFKFMLSQQSIHSFVGGTPAAGDSIALPCEFNMADNNFYPLEGTGYVRVWLGISADGAITADDVKDIVINVPFYDEDVTATEWYNTGERYISDPQVAQNTEDIAALDTRVTALEEDSGSGGGITVNTNQVLYAVGDSITRGAAAGGEDYAWPKHVIDINGYDATNSRNLGQNGLGFDTAATSSGDTIKDVVDNTDFSAADIVTVALGCNDWKNSNALLTNVWANMEYCFNKIRTDNPYCKLFYILPFNMSFMGTFATFYCLSGKGDSNPLCPYSYTLMQYINMIKDKLATPTFQAFHINVIDMVECAAINRQNITTALADQVHPTAATQAELGKEIARRIVLADGAGGVLPVYTGGVI